MKKIFLFLLFPVVLFADVHTAASAEQADVLTAVAASSIRDSVIIPADTATWDKGVTITHGVFFIGAGSDKTKIIANFEAEDTGMVTYRPSDPSVNTPFRISGFTFDSDSTANGVYLSNLTSNILDSIRIDHNIFIGEHYQPTIRAISINGTFYGVIDNNTLTGILSSYGYLDSNWKNLSRNYGDKNNIYYEDNTFIKGVSGVFHDGGHGGRYVSRYNDYSGTIVPAPPRGKVIEPANTYKVDTAEIDSIIKIQKERKHGR